MDSIYDLSEQTKSLELMCLMNGSWSLQPSDIPTCQPISCSAPAMTQATAKNWNISYMIYYKDNPSPATTTFILICKEDMFFVNRIANFTAVCGVDK
jgi:hypothetical protein